MKKKLRAASICVQGGYEPKNGEPIEVPIIQSTTFKYDNSEEMAMLFDLKKEGYFYTRLQNPTNDAVAKKIAQLEGGVGAVLTSSGQAANFYAVFNICEAGDHIVTSNEIYGGTFNLFGVTLKKLGIECTFVNPNDSGAGGAGCFRYHMDRPDAPEGVDKRSETLEDLMRAIPYWFAPAMHAYVGREEALPFDQHMLKACVAPRYLLQTEGLDDTWANPKGSYQTLLAAREVYKLLGAEDHIAAYYREGGHAHGYREYIQLLDFMQACLRGERAPEHYYEHPYPEMENIFDWACPGKD